MSREQMRRVQLHSFVFFVVMWSPVQNEYIHVCSCVCMYIYVVHAEVAWRGARMSRELLRRVQLHSCVFCCKCVL